jgi:NADPH-dependent glutamate synthase beta subunit-like oxidoreductase/ferredoxin
MNRQRVDPMFKYKILEAAGGETFAHCYQCGTCTATCPASCLIEVLRPNKVIQLAKLGIRNNVYSDGFWLCAGCNACINNCPQGVKIPEIMHTLKKLAIMEDKIPEFLGNFDVLRDMPLPVLYCWLCLDPDDFPANHYLMNARVRKMLTSYLHTYQEARPVVRSREKIAIIGSGPAGLTAAWELIRRGFNVTIFEKLNKAGGMLRVGLPEHRLPKNLLDAEIQHLIDLGVELQINNQVDKPQFKRILEEYNAVFIASGSHKVRRLQVEGEDLKGVVHALDFFQQVSLERMPGLDRVIVIGGGGVAIDAARTAVRCGADVTMFCLEARQDIPGHEWELQSALAEGVDLATSWGVKRILGNSGHVKAVELKRCIQVFDDTGRFNPKYDDSKINHVEADTVILAIGQMPDLSYLEGVKVIRGVVIDRFTMSTNLKQVYAGGDAVKVVGSILQAIIDGKQVANSIATMFRGEEISR